MVYVQGRRRLFRIMGRQQCVAPRMKTDNTKLTPFPFSKRRYLIGLIFMAALMLAMVLGLLTFLYGAGAKILEKSVPLVHASVETQLQLSRFRLLYEEMIQRDSSFAKENLWRRLKEAVHHNRVMLEGGVIPEGRVYPLENPQLRALAERSGALIQELGELAAARLKTNKNNVAGTKISQRFGVIFKEALKHLGGVDRGIMANVDSQLLRFRYTAFSLAAIIIVLAVMVGFYFFRYERQRLRTEVKIRESHEGLELRVEQRARQLACEIEERKQAEEALKTARGDLEQRVKQRTAELKKIHDELDMRVARQTHQLLESEGKFRLMAENIPSVFWIFTPNLDEMIYVSPAYETIWGRSCESLYESPKSFLNTVHPDDLESVREKKGVKEGETRDMEYRIIMPYGSVRWIHDRGVPAFDAKRNATLIAGLATDITERKLAEEKIMELAKFPELNPGPVMRFSMDGELLFANKASECLLNLFKCKVGGTLDKNWLKTFNESVQSDGTGEMDCACETSDCNSRKHTFSLLIKHIPETGSIYVYGRDITMRKQAVVALKAAHDELEQRVKQRTAELQSAKEEAEQANKAKTGFLAAASHDLRQPMQALNLFVSVLSNREHDEKSRDIINKIERSTNALEDLLNALLDISRLEAGIVTAKPIDFHISDLLERLGDEFKPLAAEKRLKLRMEPSDAMIHSDPTLLTQILQNLLSNAIRYTKQGGIVCACKRKGDNLRIEVQDTGDGIPESQMKKIFQEFHQIEENSGGLGLGLSIVDKLARLLGQQIDVSSTLGKGSVFAMEAPLAGAPLKKAEAAQPLPQAKINNAFILVIDDEADVLAGMEVRIKAWGHKVLTAQSGKDALNGLTDCGRIPDLIISDYRLSRKGETGSKAIRAIQKKLKADIPGLLITGDTGPGRLRQAKRSGFRLLHKPAHPIELQQTINEMLISAK